MLKSRIFSSYANVLVIAIFFITMSGRTAANAEEKYDVSLYITASRTYESGQYQKTIELMEKFIPSCQDADVLINAKHFLGMSYKNVGSFERAAETINALIKDRSEFALNYL